MATGSGSLAEGATRRVPRRGQQQRWIRSPCGSSAALLQRSDTERPGFARRSSSGRINASTSRSTRAGTSLPGLAGRSLPPFRGLWFQIEREILKKARVPPAPNPSRSSSRHQPSLHPSSFHSGPKKKQEAAGDGGERHSQVKRWVQNNPSQHSSCPVSGVRLVVALTAGETTDETVFA